MHCSDAPGIAVCPVDCIYETNEGVVLHSKDLCIRLRLLLLRLPVRDDRRMLAVAKAMSLPLVQLA